MNQDENKQALGILSDRKKSLSPLKLAIILLGLYIQQRYFSNDSYKYNYSYLPPLSITNVPESEVIEKILGIPLPNFPKGSFPNLIWVVKVIYRVLITIINDYLEKNEESVSIFKQNFSEISNNLDSIEADFEESENQNKLEACVKTLEINLRQLDQKFNLDSQLEENYQPFNSIHEKRGLIELLSNQLLDFDEKIAKLFRQRSTETSIIVSLQNILKYATKMAEIADVPQPELAQSPESLTLDDYNRLYQIIEKPLIADVFRDDRIFAYLQVAGANPLVLQGFDQQHGSCPVSPDQYSAIAAKFGVVDSLAEVIESQRLYVSDYGILNSLVNGNYINQELVQQKYICAPIAFFAVPPEANATRCLFPVAITYRKTAMSEQWTTFTPLDTDSQGEPWMSAKNIVQMADCNYHELISHLGRTHLVVEAFAVPTYNLPEEHPLRNLLIPHLEGTVVINYGAHAFLVAPGGTVDSLLASSIGSDQSLSSQGTQSYLFNFNAINFPQNLVNRRVDNPHTLPIYPYRDDGQLIWDAIHTWVKDYVSIYYTHDAAVASDQALQHWATTLASINGGRLSNFGEDSLGHINTKDYLSQVLSTLIFTASAQHAAVNFPQKTLMTYVPGFPLARYSPPPTHVKETQSFLDGLPSLSQAQSQINILYLLGSVYYTQLGHYSSSAFSNSQPLQTALDTFHRKLNQAHTIIHQRNQSSERLFPYECLLPTNIPQSINI
ncbi:lipoxygenase family protein [Crocosphaera subtropica]|nr:lipoxygenase family protein [Crocosphaera subtropica]